MSVPDEDENAPTCFRCTICAIHWRPLEYNKTCPQCGEPTRPFYKTPHDPDDELIEVGGPASVGRFTPRPLTVEEETYVVTFRAWLDTVGPEDFRNSINYPPDHPQAHG